MRSAAWRIESCLIRVAGAIGEVQNALVIGAPPGGGVRSPDAHERLRAVRRVPARGAGHGDRDGDDDGRGDDPPAPQDAANVDPERDLDVVCASGVHRLRVDEFQTAGGVRRPEASAATCSESPESFSRITCDR